MAAGKTATWEIEMPKTTGWYHAVLYKDNTIMLRPSDSRDLPLLKKLFSSKKEREQRRKQEILVNVTLDIPYQKRSIKEINTAWKLIDVIFQSINKRKGTEEELYALYEDLLPEYAEKVPCVLFPDKLRSVRLSEANSVQAATFIDGLLFHLSQITGLNQDLQADVRAVIYEWETWRGQHSPDFTANMTEKQWRERATYSEASGIGGNDIDKHHMLTRGAHANMADDPENWIALNRCEHQEFHDIGEEAFLQKYPHLEGRFKRAHEKFTEEYKDGK